MKEKATHEFNNLLIKLMVSSEHAFVMVYSG